MAAELTQRLDSCGLYDPITREPFVDSVTGMILGQISDEMGRPDERIPTNENKKVVIDIRGERLNKFATITL